MSSTPRKRASARSTSPSLGAPPAEAGGARWLVLIHQIPPTPGYLRVKIRRRLQTLGAVAIKNTVYALPWSDQAHEDFQWVLREVVEGGGDGSILNASLADGLSDADVEEMFNTARDADFAALDEDTRAVDATLGRGRKVAEERIEGAEGQLHRLRARYDDIVALDFFGASGRETSSGLLRALDARLTALRAPSPGAANAPSTSIEPASARTWVTRTGVHVDRIASAWLIRTRIDPQARFKFVPAKGYEPIAGELRFDMFEAEYTHEGDRCTFEVLLRRHALDDPALHALAEIVHDIDLRDGKYGRPETAGIQTLIAGIATAHRDDDARLARGAAVLDDLYAYFSRKRR